MQVKKVNDREKVGELVREGWEIQSFDSKVGIWVLTKSEPDEERLQKTLAELEKMMRLHLLSAGPDEWVNAPSQLVSIRIPVSVQKMFAAFQMPMPDGSDPPFSQADVEEAVFNSLILRGLKDLAMEEVANNGNLQ